MLNIEQLLQPVGADRPCGDDLAFSTDVDTIARARQHDEPGLEQGAWVTALKEADWDFVGARCAQLIASHSKDLRLAVWLVEAKAKTRQFAGMADALELLAGLCQRYWERIHPLPDEGGQEQRVGNLCWLAARMPRLAREIALTESGRHTLTDFESVRAHGAGQEGGELEAMEAARRGGSREFHAALLADVERCVRALGALEEIVDQRLGADGPGFSAARAALADVIHFVLPAAREVGVETADEAGRAGETVAAAPAGQAGPILSRAQALAQLRTVAEYFRRTEPHSPVAYLADKAASWGEQPLHVWLRAVVKDPASFSHIEELLGLQTPAQ